MSNLATIGGFTQVAQAFVAIELNESGFPLDPVSGVPSINNTVNIAGVNTPVQAVALYTVDGSGNNPVPGSGGNATVPPDAPIQPPQEFVDLIPTLTTKIANDALTSASQLDWSNKALTSLKIGVNKIDPLASWFWVYQQLLGAGVASLNASGNLINVAGINAVLADCVSLFNDFGVIGILDLSDQAPPAPPTLDCMSVSGAGTTAANGVYTPRGTVNGKEFYNLIGQADSTSNWTIAWADFATGSGVTWGITDGTASLLYLSLDDVATPDLVTTWIVAPSGGSPVPTVTAANASKVQLVAAGWTVTTD